MSNPVRPDLSAHPLWPKAASELRAVLEHMASPTLSARRPLHRQAGSEVYPRSLLAAVALSLVQELVLTRPPLGRVEREAIAEACYAAGDRLAAPGYGG